MWNAKVRKYNLRGSENEMNLKVLNFIEILATFLFKAMRLSQVSLELSSSRGVFGSLENERKRREKRATGTLK